MNKTKNRMLLLCMFMILITTTMSMTISNRPTNRILTQISSLRQVVRVNDTYIEE